MEMEIPSDPSQQCLHVFCNSPSTQLFVSDGWTADSVENLFKIEGKWDGAVALAVAANPQPFQTIQVFSRSWCP